MFTDRLVRDERLASRLSDLNPNRSFNDYLGQFPLLEFDAVQLGAGEFDHRSLEIWGRHSVLVRDRLTPLSAFTMVGQPDWIMIIWPHAWAGDFRVDAKVAETSDVFMLEAGKEWHTSGAERDTLSLGIRRSVLAAACADLRGVDAAAISACVLLPSSPAMAELLGRIFARALETARGLGPVGGRLVMPPVFEADMIADLAACLDGLTADSVAANRDNQSTARIVAATRTLLQEQDPAGLNLTELCRAVGVSRTRLHHCFVDTFGISAGRYIKNNRLSQAREWLSDPDNPPPSVKHVALTLGFSSSGRFAGDYQKLFCELPSATLARHLPRARPEAHDPS